MKKLILSVCAILLLVGCTPSASTKESDATPTPTSNTQTYKHATHHPENHGEHHH